MEASRTVNFGMQTARGILYLPTSPAGRYVIFTSLLRKNPAPDWAYLIWEVAIVFGSLNLPAMIPGSDSLRVG